MRSTACPASMLEAVGISASRILQARWPTDAAQISAAAKSFTGHYFARCRAMHVENDAVPTAWQCLVWSSLSNKACAPPVCALASSLRKQ